MITTIICLSNPDVLPVACEVGHAHLPQERNDRLNIWCRMAFRAPEQGDWMLDQLTNRIMES